MVPRRTPLELDQGCLEYRWEHPLDSIDARSIYLIAEANLDEPRD